LSGEGKKENLGKSHPEERYNPIPVNKRGRVVHKGRNRGHGVQKSHRQWKIGERSKKKMYGSWKTCKTKKTLRRGAETHYSNEELVTHVLYERKRRTRQKVKLFPNPR